MRSLCHNLRTSYERLQTLTAEFTVQYLAVKVSGDLTKGKQLKKELEQAKDALMEQLLVFRVLKAKNPYREALLEAGVPEGTATAETQEALINIPEEITRQTKIYAECKDAAGNNILIEWAQDITQKQDLLFSEVSKDYENIVARIKAGMIPTIMPSRTVQEQTWKKALTNLKPVWTQSGKPETVKDAFIYDKFEAEKMNQAGFFKDDIPDRPYIVWNKPSLQTDLETRNKTFADQQKQYAKMVIKNPELYDPTDITPTEFIALEANATNVIQEKCTQAGVKPSTIQPLDVWGGSKKSLTRFLSAGAFSGGDVPCACFDPGYRQVSFNCDFSDADGEHGFRPAARS